MLCSSVCSMEVLSMIKHSLVADGGNPITKYFQIGRHVASAGPELVWKIYDAVRIEDKQEVSVFIFEKRIADKLHKPKRRETVAEILRREVKHLERMKHPKFLQVVHTVEECHDSLAFATEPVLGSLANFLGSYDRCPNPLPAEIKDNEFLEVEIKYGVLQITDALAHLHGAEQLLHGNVNPQSILVNKKGTWKLSGMGFAEKTADGKDSFTVTPWTSKSPKMAQPDLDYLAPELQLEKNGTFLSDMFSLGLVICAVYNQGKSLMDSNKNIQIYAKKNEQLHDTFSEMAHNLPLTLVEPVEKMINKDIRYRPTAQLFVMLKWFIDPVVKCLQFLDVIEQTDMSQRLDFYNTLPVMIPQIPRKILYQHVFPTLREQMKSQDMLVHVFPSCLSLIEHSTQEEYKTKLFPGMKKIFCMPKPVSATCVLLDHIHIILAKTPKEEVPQEVLPLVFNMLDSNSAQGQEAALNTIADIQEYLDEIVMRKQCLPKAKSLYTKSSSIKMKVNALLCIDKLLDKLDKMIILDEVLPFLTEITYPDTEILMAVIGIYKHMLSDKKFGLTHNLIASKVMPPLIPCTVSPGLDMEQFSTLMEVLREMLEQIDRQRRNKMKLERINSAGSLSSRPTIKMHINVEKPGDMQSLGDLRGTNKNYLCVDDAACLHNISKQVRTDPDTPELLKSLLNMRTLNHTPNQQVSRYSVKPLRRHSTAGIPLHLTQILGQYKPPAPSTPEAVVSPRPGQPSGIASNPLPRRRHSSVHGLGQPINNADPKNGSPQGQDRRYSFLLPDGTRNPNLLLPDSMHDGPFGSGSNRRLSTQSLGPVVVPEDKTLSIPSNRRTSTQSVGAVIVSNEVTIEETSAEHCNGIIDPERRDSKLTIFDTLSPTLQRRTSFSSFGDTVMQLFTGKT